jgi:hypothetical protein
VLVDGKHEVASAIGKLDDVIFGEPFEHDFGITEWNLVTTGRL